MIPSDADLVLLQQNAYATIPAGEIIDCGPDRIVLSRLAECAVVTVRGTNSPAGWWSDFQVCPKVERVHPRIGTCESGFLAGAEALFPLVLPWLIDAALPVVVQGHSRGAEIAPILVGLLITGGVVPVRCVCWEKPWGNGPELRAMLEQVGIAGVEYWHGDDPVPLAPPLSWLVMANFHIVHFGHWTANPFDSHHIDGIVADVKAGALTGVTS